MAKEVQVPVITERQIGSSNVYFFGVEHNTDPETYPLETMRYYIANKCSKVVGEYFIPELKITAFSILKSDEYSSLNGIVPFSNALGSLAQAERKNILFMDPANNIWFQLLHEYLPVNLAASALTSLMALSLSKDNEIPKYLQTANRRQFLKYGLLLTTGVGLEGTSGRAQDIPLTDGSLSILYRDLSFNMRDMRWVTVTQGLTQYCLANPSDDLLVVYPQGHIRDGFLHYLDHPEHRKFKYQLYSMIPGITRAIREYQSSGSGWTLAKEPIPIVKQPT